MLHVILCSVLNAGCPFISFLLLLRAACSVKQMNELLNRWRHGEVNLLQRRFRLARAQSVKSTIASKIRGSVAPSSSNSGTATSAGTATSTIREASFAEDGSLSPASHEGATEMDSKKPPDGQMPGQLRVGGGVGENGEAISLGNVGGARAGMDKEAFLRVFSDVRVRFGEGWRCPCLCNT